jgi:hypothetical protein
MMLSKTAAQSWLSTFTNLSRNVFAKPRSNQFAATEIATNIRASAKDSNCP